MPRDPCAGCLTGKPSIQPLTRDSPYGIRSTYLLAAAGGERSTLGGVEGVGGRAELAPGKSASGCSNVTVNGIELLRATGWVVLVVAMVGLRLLPTEIPHGVRRSALTANTRQAAGNRVHLTLLGICRSLVEAAWRVGHPSWLPAFWTDSSALCVRWPLVRNKCPLLRTKSTALRPKKLPICRHNAEYEAPQARVAYSALSQGFPETPSASKGA